MQEIRKNWVNNWGYVPTDDEILKTYLNGSLNLTNKQENEILIYFNL